MNDPISFFVPGIPKAQPRPRAFARKFGDKWAARVYDAGTAECWKSQIAAAARPHLPKHPISGPVSVQITYYMPRPKSHYRTGKYSNELRADAPRFHIVKPDAQNCSKGSFDALTQIGMWQDDCQICQESAAKIYAGFGQPTGADITIRPLDALAVAQQGELTNV